MVLSAANSVHLCVLLLLVSVSSRVLVHGQIGACTTAGCRCTESYECCLEVSEGVQNAVVGNATIQPEFVSSINELNQDQYEFTVPESSGFLIDPDSGEITTNGEFEREMPQETVDCLVIVVTLQLMGVGIVPHSFAVNIEDINDNTPVFPSEEYEFTVPEGEPTTNLVCDSNLQATDRDIGSITYRVTAPSSDFSIDRATSTNELCISSLIDLDRDGGPPSVSLTIEARDQGGNFDTATVILTIMDINDNPPEFADEKTNLTVPENQQQGIIIRLEATDSDVEEANRMITYSLIPQQDAFEIDGETGDLQLKEDLRYDADNPDNNKLQFTVQAVDMGDDPQTGSTVVTIIIQDVNEMARLTPFSQPEEEIVEETVEDTSIILAFGIQDRDSPENSNNYLKFISGGEFFNYTNNEPGLFPFTDIFRILQVASIDREERSVVELSVELIEGGNPELRRTINSTINILDINDNLPELTQNITRHMENDAPRTLIVQVPTIAMDRDDGVNGTIIEYKLISVTGCSNTTEESCTGGKDLTGDFSGLFADFKVDGLLFAPRLDREEDGPYLRIVLELTDGGNMSANHSFTLEILDENDESPTFQQNGYEFSILEELPQSNVAIGSVTATDRDNGENGTVSYSLTQPSDDFEIDPVTGVISSLRSFDREETPSFTIFITAQDNGDPPNSATNMTEVVIEITDINDNVPTFDLQQETRFAVSADAEVGSVVGKVTASDRDVGENAAVIFRLEPSMYFTISDDNTGCITVTQLFTGDFPLGDFPLTVTAFNGGQAEGSSLNITITVTMVSATGLSSEVIVAASAGGAVFLLIAILIVSFCSLVLYCKNRRGKLELSSIDGSLNNGRPGSPKGILVQIPTTVMRRGSGRVAFDDKVQKMVYDHKQSVTCDEAVYKVESNTNFGSGDESSPRIPHNGSIPSEGPPLANGMPSSLYNHRSRQRSPILLQEEEVVGHQEIDLSESSTLDEQSHFPYDVNSDEESIISDDVSHMNAEIPRFRSPEEHTTGLSSSMRYAATYPHQQHSSSPLHLVGPMPPIEYHEPISHAYQPPQLSDNLTLTPPPSPHSHSHNIPSSTHSPAHPISSLGCAPTTPASYISALNGTNRSNYPIVMPDAFGRGTPDVHMFQDRFMPSFSDYDMETSTCASSELDEALNFPPETEPGIYSLTDVYSGDDNTV